MRMEKQFLLDRYPIYKLEINKSELNYQSTQLLVNYFKDLMDEHKIVRFIAEFDHYSHTKGLEQSEINPSIIDARIITFCFGNQLTSGEILALRPCSIGIAETESIFIFSFMESPMTLVNETIKAWIDKLHKNTST